MYINKRNSPCIGGERTRTGLQWTQKDRDYQYVLSLTCGI